MSWSPAFVFSPPWHLTQFASRSGLTSFSKKTIPEVGQLVLDLRQMAAALTSVAEKIDRGGAGGLIGAPQLPDCQPRNR